MKNGEERKERKETLKKKNREQGGEQGGENERKHMTRWKKEKKQETSLLYLLKCLIQKSLPKEEIRTLSVLSVKRILLIAHF